MPRVSVTLALSQETAPQPPGSVCLLHIVIMDTEYTQVMDLYSPRSEWVAAVLLDANRMLGMLPHMFADGEQRQKSARV